MVCFYTKLCSTHGYHTRVVPEVRRQNLKCFKMTSDIDITLPVYTYTCVFQIMDIHKPLNITTEMVAMATLPLHVRSTSKFIAITLARNAENEAGTDFHSV